MSSTMSTLRMPNHTLSPSTSPTRPTRMSTTPRICANRLIVMLRNPPAYLLACCYEVYERPRRKDEKNSLLPFIHRSAWKGCSTKFACRIPHNPGPMGPETPSLDPLHKTGRDRSLRVGWIGALVDGRGADKNGTYYRFLKCPAVALYGPAHHLEPLAGYLGVRLVHHAGVALGVAVHEPLVLLDVLERLAPPPPVVDGLALSPLLVVAHSPNTLSR